MKKILVVSLFCVIGGSFGQIVQNGQCNPDISLEANFELERFLGRWYEIARTDNPAGGDCSSIEFTSVGQAITVTHTTVRENFFAEYQGQATAAAGTPRLQLNLPQLSSNPIQFWLLRTDHDNFTLAYGCENLGNTQRQVYIWQLGRTTSPPTEMTQAALNLIMNNNFGITITDLRAVSHSNDACYILPTIQAGQPVILPGQCDRNIKGVANFSAPAFLGVWHQIQSYYSSNAGGTCNRAQYSDGGDKVDVVNSQVQNQALYSLSGNATVISNDNTGQLRVVLEVLPGVFEESELLVLGTNYTQWAVTYTCVDLANNTKQVFSWISSRTRVLHPDARAEVNQVINSLIDLNNQYYQTTDQSDESCFYVPESQTPGEPVVYGGQCNLNIPVVSNFSAGDYMGLWHEIERYPTPFQFGACNNAFYTLRDGVVDVFNTQVLDEQLLTIDGLAVPVANGKLVVSFPVEGTNLTTETDYWVLSTDYGNYSLVYSCRNINDYQQQVTFWKLSRTKQLIPEAEAAINLVMNSLTILNQQHFVPTDQSPQGCFYYPEPQPGVPVVFPGTCEANINVVSNFNLTAFQGTWYEVEAYPKDPQEGECVYHEFSAGSATSLNFLSSYVEDQLLGTTNGQLTLYPGETAGRFTLSFTSNGTTISFPYYVVATNYLDYAVVYSCVNDGTDFRRVFAWKLSRNKQLSEPSETAIGNFLNSTDSSVVLSNNYFEKIDQSDYACFYFPDLAPGEPVVLPGQCEDLPVMANLNVTAYAGRWYLIESYPADNQVGQCNQATYTLNADDTIGVYNNEVANQTLREANGVARVLANGKLSVTFPNNPTPFELTILGTDYANYSVVYGCVNVGTTQRRVQSWKFSRTTELTADAIEAIDAITSNITVLNDRYYQTVDQSDDACFYYPPVGAGPMVFRGQCNQSIPVVTSFDADAYMGLWHDIESYPVPFQNGDCPNAFYTLNTDLGLVEVFNTQVVPNATLDTIAGFATLVPSTDGSAKLEVSFPTLPNNSTTPYWVLDTDYTNYALVYSCVDINDEYRSVTSWKLSRSKELNATSVATINAIVDTIPVLDDRYYNKRDQSRDGCFYFPEPEPGVPVKFPGQCDDSISVVTNFNLSRFSGLWHEVEAYPKDQQTGDCVNHQFRQNGNTFILESNSVSAQSLGVTEGVVTLANPAVAKMSISIVSNGTVIQIPYWILDTDYDNYALAYSCVNLDDDYRGIYSWKLSRRKELRQVDITAINTTIADVDVLGNQYYEKINQTNEACFYYPEPTGRPVVFPGQCGNIQAMSNFNATRYLGLWRTIESYPSNFQLGTCGDATYSLGNGVVNVYNTEVIDQTLSTINGTAVAATDGTGKLYVTFPNALEVSEYLILNTDYETYSIVYSCANDTENDQRIVHSWKLSRTNSLLTTAQSAIAAVVNSFDVLDERYYQLENRTADACFYFPEADGSTVIFRGQCDLTIPVQANFNATAYMGTWYNIESYPAPFQGTCGTANYELGDGVVLVENTQVIDRELDVQIGTAAVVDNAKLAVTFNVSGQVFTTDYWILATDYDSYSFVYSCQNINAYYKQVNSFKLSRSKTLLASAQSSINNVINNVKVLEQRYFVEEKQDDASCFTYPEIQNGNVILEGTCVPDNQVPVITSFNANQFSGVWHEVDRFPSDLQEGECSATNFAYVQNTFTLTNTIVQGEAQSSSVLSGTVATDGRGVINVNGAGVPYEALYVLDTNYSDYALLYACRNLPNETKQIYSWKLARSRNGFSSQANTTLNNLVAQNDDLAPKYYFETKQTSAACFHYPEYDVLPLRIELEGHCDQTIRGDANFNATAYLGVWKEIERHPEPNQFGTCDRAFYSPGDGNVLVRNTQVVGNSLLDQTGTAAVASTDGTGLLSVDFNVNGVQVNANYYILATDYDEYALVYSCRNTEDTNGYPKRIVSSWKLSRSDTLSSQAQADITRVINQTEGLSERFYQKTSQTAEDCFYIPDVDVNRAPLFRGTCGTTNGVSNFNISRFAGWWNELERYPVDNNVGQCINSQYTTSGSTLQVVDTSVSGGNGVVVTGTATANSNAVLTKVLSTGVTQEIVILETDYENYALLYSCEDVTVNDEPYRKVWSAKHSRTRDPASVKVAAIDTAITNNTVLYDQFYQTVDQSNQACFYYPEVQGQRVILPGQCDESIPVVTNFNVAAYGGTWYQIERYPQIHENPNSTCIGARYLLENDVVSVLNWEVIEGELSTIEGNATVTSTDGSAKLSVVLPVVGTELTVTTPLYVLATDYETYSIAYSCSNYGPFQRSIGAWKLSRERTMLPAGTSAINDVISRREELNQNYFLPVQHGDQCPEPSSSVLVRSSVVMMLICLVVQLF